MREIGKREQLYGPQDAKTKEMKERAVRATKEWASTQHDEWQKKELEHANDRERAWKDYMEVLTDVNSIQETNSTHNDVV
jgi:hypothetical protein